MTHYLIIADMPEEYHTLMKDELEKLNKLGYGNHLRELKIYELTINNENEKVFDEVMSRWHSNILKHELNPVLRFFFNLFLRFLIKGSDVSIVKSSKTFNMRTLIIKSKDKYKKVPDLL
jgi:DNA-binding FadR family transcriptional regulator